MSLGLNILLIFIFLLLGSVFAGTELALVSLRGSQIDQMEQEDARGKRVAQIARDPNTFLSTVQIGVTLSGFLSASFGESSIAPYIVPVVEGWGVPKSVAAPLTTIVLTLIISYCSIVISELVPKRIAMQRNEQIARAVVPAIHVFAKVCKPIIWLIGKNTNGIVRLLGFDPNETDSEVSDEELRVLVNTNTKISARTNAPFSTTYSMLPKRLWPKSCVLVPTWSSWTAACRLAKQPPMYAKCRIPATP